MGPARDDWLRLRLARATILITNPPTSHATTSNTVYADFRLGGLQPGQTRHVRGKIYIVPADVGKLLARYEKDFPEQVSSPKSGE